MVLVGGRGRARRALQLQARPQAAENAGGAGQQAQAQHAGLSRKREDAGIVSPPLLPRKASRTASDAAAEAATLTMAQLQICDPGGAHGQRELLSLL